MRALRDNDFEADMVALVERYALSWYASVDRIDPERVVDGKTVPIARGNELVEVLRENVEQAKWDRDGVRKRYEDAQREGLFDLKRVEEVSPDTREKWLASVEMMKGDKVRCISELTHWREYLSLALKGELPELKRVVDPRNLARHLADAKSYPPDPRLPVERDPEDVL